MVSGEWSALITLNSCTKQVVDGHLWPVDLSLPQLLILRASPWQSRPEKSHGSKPPGSPLAAAGSKVWKKAHAAGSCCYFRDAADGRVADILAG